jgi:hypothetical protein
MNVIQVNVTYEGYIHYFSCCPLTTIKDLHNECISKFDIVGGSYFASGRSLKKILDGVKIWDIKRNNNNETNLSLIPIINQTVYTNAGAERTKIIIKMSHGLKIYLEVSSTCTLNKIMLSCSKMYSFNKNIHSFHINGVLIPSDMNDSTIKELGITSKTAIEIKMN